MRFLVVLLFLPLLATTALPPATAAPVPSLPGDPTPSAPNAVRVAFEFRLLDALDAFQVDARFEVREAELDAQQGLSAQAIRDAGPAVHEAFEAYVRDAFRTELENAFADAEPTGTQFRFRYGASDLDGNPYEPPILVEAAARVALTPALLGLTGARFTTGGELARSFLYSGGAVVINRSLAVPAGYDAEIAVSVPGFVRLDSARTANASRIVFPNDNSLGAAPRALKLAFVLGLRPEAVPGAVRDGPLVRATFVAHDDTPLWMKAIPFTPGRYSADLDLWIEVPSLKASYFGASPLPPNLRAERYGADLLRIAVRERLVTETDLHAFFADLITRGLEEGFGESARIEMDVDAFRQSVQKPLGSANVEPLLIHARAKLPLRSEKMVVGSALAQTFGSIAGIPASFPIENTGSWRLDLTLLYPEGTQVEVHDSLGRATKAASGDREGLRVVLDSGESTQLSVHGRPGWDPAVLALGLFEFALLAAGITWAAIRMHRARARRRPWAPR